MSTEKIELTVTDNPKMLHETLCVAQTILGRHTDGVRTGEHVARIQRLINETERHRPLGPDGKHGDRHTDTCGCDDVPPAPLDPSKVKPGDTVTLSRGKSSVTAEVTHVQNFIHLEHLGRFRVKGLSSDRTSGYAEYTLTDHQPAPEPEPSWREGVVGTATVGPKRREVRAYAVAKGAVIEAVGGGYAVWNSDDVHGFVPDEPRPLPTREQVKAALEPGWGRDSITAMVDAVLALLRGESR
ncbi:MAG TPA: hypothetical protein VKY86_01595 [Promicromonospora sp.]|nr:hypothetical protein [Promicromonospora sp.]